MVIGQIIFKEIVPGTANESAPARRTVCGLSLVVEDVAYVTIFDTQRDRDLACVFECPSRRPRFVHHLEIRMESGEMKRNAVA